MNSFRDSETNELLTTSPVERLHLCIRNGKNNDLVKEMITQGTVSPMAEVETNFTSPLGTAIESNNHEIVELLVAHPGCDVNVGSRRGRPAIYMAAKKGSARIVQALLHGGANMELKGLDGDSALLVAVRSGHQEVVRVLVEAGCDLDAKDNANTSAIHLAALNGHEEIARFLLEKGCDPNAIASPKSTKEMKIDPSLGIRPLHYAAHIGNSNLARLLVAHGADVDAKSYGYRTPLHTAATWDSSEVVDVLVEAGCDVNAQSQEGDQRKTALGMAVDGGRKKIVRKLLAAGASVSLGSPLLTAIYQGNEHIVLSLLQAGADVNQQSHNGTTAFQLSLQYLPTLPLLLLLAGCKLTEEDKNKLQSTLTSRTKDYVSAEADILADMAFGVHPLKCMCRCVIRQQMGVLVRTDIQYLPLPRPLIGFVSLMDMESG
ncbi:uncharacterized protein LOC106157731 [Lingula anatina]|uniref:Uncharacterized protein LOC106157731 n=1 Tax=Lingula anatina TaxID=7574 RepID=A0A1S3HSB1_LINAN|nr:uncharacterized protein LOC106157731 [Lingula anatina]|eukprot:XP_013388922.1 uncharacterized protein LOC106157731 [Lingula anatina]